MKSCSYKTFFWLQAPFFGVLLLFLSQKHPGPRWKQKLDKLVLLISSIHKLAKWGLQEKFWTSPFINTIPSWEYEVLLILGNQVSSSLKSSCSTIAFSLLICRFLDLRPYYLGFFSLAELNLRSLRSVFNKQPDYRESEHFWKQISSLIFVQSFNVKWKNIKKAEINGWEKSWKKDESYSFGFL